MRNQKKLTNNSNSVPPENGILKKIIILLLISVPLSSYAENKISFKQEIYNIVSHDTDENVWYYTSAGNIGISGKKTEGSKEVKAGVDLSLVPLLLSIPGQEAAYQTTLSLDKAFVKTSFSRIQLTMGKTRISWGEGAAFNAGDVIFGSSDPFIDMSAEEIRTDTGWLTALNIPIGRFSFIETLVMPPPVLIDPLNPSSYTIQEWDKSSAGARIYIAEFGRFKTECGYFYKGDEGQNGTHNPYLSLHGFLLLDWYAAATLPIPVPGKNSDNKWEWNDYKDSLSISAGAFYQFEIGYGNNAGLRLESMIMPYQEWDLSGNNGGKSYSEILQEGRSYGIMLYPDFSLSFPEGQFLNIRSMISPVDQSAQSSLGGGWNLYQGLYLFAYITMNTGEEEDIFSWKRDSGLYSSNEGLFVMTGLRFTY